MTSPGATRRPGFGLPSLVVTGVGAVLLLVSFLLLDWFEGIDLTAPIRRDGIDAHTSLTLREAYVASSQSRLGALVHTYVSWVGWTLVFVAVLAAVVASLPGRRSRQWRVVGVVAGIAAAIVTYFVCQLDYAHDPDHRLHIDAHAGFGDAEIGAKLTVAAFLLCAVGAALGPLGARSVRAVQRRPDDAGGTRRAASIAALVAGGTLLVLAFDHSSWYHTDRYDADPQISFGDLTNIADGRAISRISAAFFPTLAWVLLLAALSVVVFANLRTALTPVLRVAGIVVGLSGGVLIYLALARLFVATYNPAAQNGERGVFFSTSPGLWFAFAGYLLCAVAVVLAPPAGPRPTSTTMSPADPTDADGVSASVTSGGV